MCDVKELLLRTGSHAGVGRGGVHAGVLQNLDQLEAKGRYVLFDFVHIVLGYPLVFRLPLLHSHVSSHQITHDALPNKTCTITKGS